MDHIQNERGCKRLSRVVHNNLGWAKFGEVEGPKLYQGNRGNVVKRRVTVETGGKACTVYLRHAKGPSHELNKGIVMWGGTENKDKESSLRCVV